MASTSLAVEDRLGEAARKAWEQHQKGRTDEAIKTMERAAAQFPGGTGQLVLSRFRARLGGEDNLTAALASARQAVQESASAAPSLKAEALAHLAALELRLASSKDALAHAEQAVQAASTPETLETLARVQVRRGRSAQALETADKAVQAGGASGAAWSGKGFALVGLDRPGDAEAAFRKALEVEPARHQARIGLAAALLGLRKAAEAEAEARRAVDEKTGDPRDEEGFGALGLAILATSPDDPHTWSRAIGEAQTGATVLNPNNPAVRHAAGKIFEHRGELAQAATHYAAALAVDPGFVGVRQALVQVLIWQKKGAEAVALARGGVGEDPESAGAQLLLGQVLLSSQAYAEATPPLEAAARLAPTQAEVHAALGTAYRLTGDLDPAAAAYKRALDLKPGDTDLRLAYADLLVALKEPQTAVGEYRKVVEAAGYLDPIGWIKLGSAYRKMKPPRVEEAVAAYRQALGLDPKNAAAALGIGLAYYAGERCDEAILAFQDTVMAAPVVAADAEVYTAWCYVAKDEADKATVHLEKAGRPEPQLEEAIKRIKGGQGRGPRPPPPPPTEVDFAALTERIQSKDPAVRLGAVRELCRLGREAVELLVFATANDTDWDVREQAVKCLGNVGAGARAAVPYLRQILRTEPRGGIVATPEEMSDETRLADLKRAAKEALAKIER